ncbi:hypothetical protein SAMN06264346_11853 [Chryseobacterium profundimaris]|uniref:AraC family transcriptional regulator n=1 Tax=Chryseobacterium profundimaris TaxID=1387275 RepID=A0ABY1PLS1_9FLAO|nr:hypothetical protein SAMN06264346_11853 [Chryseobacterium profundimaris]
MNKKVCTSIHPYLSAVNIFYKNNTYNIHRHVEILL